MNKIFYVLGILLFVSLTNSFAQPFNDQYNIDCDGHFYFTVTENYDSKHIPYMTDMTVLTYCISCQDHKRINSIQERNKRDSIEYQICKGYKPYEHNIIRSASRELIDPYSLFYIQSGDREYDFKFPKVDYKHKPRFVVLKERKLNAVYDFHMARMVLEFYSNDILLKKVDCQKLWYNLSEDMKNFKNKISHIRVKVTNDFDDIIEMTFSVK